MDIIGEESVLAEVEVLGAACDALRRMGLSDADWRVHVSSRALLAELLAASGIAEDRHASVFLALDKRGKIPDEEIKYILQQGGLDDAGIAKTFELLDVKGLDGAAALVAPDSPAVARLRELFRLAGIAGFADQLQFDIAVIRGLSYYTGSLRRASARTPRRRRRACTWASCSPSSATPRWRSRRSCARRGSA